MRFFGGSDFPFRIMRCVRRAPLPQSRFCARKFQQYYNATFFLIFFASRSPPRRLEHSGLESNRYPTSPSEGSLLYESVARSIARSLDRSVDRSVDRSADRSLSRSIAWSLGRSIARSIDRSVARSIDRSVDRSIGRSVDPSIGRFGKYKQRLCNI